MRGKSYKKRNDIEHEIQAKFISLMNHYSKNGYPLLESIYAIPNEGKRSPHLANKLKAGGLKSGTPDLCLPFPNGIYAALYLEFKTPPEYNGVKVRAGKLSDSQVERIELLKKLKNRVEVVNCEKVALKLVEEHTGYSLPYFNITKGV